MSNFCLISAASKVFFVRADSAEEAAEFLTRCGGQTIIACSPHNGEIPRGGVLFEV